MDKDEKKLYAYIDNYKEYHHPEDINLIIDFFITTIYKNSNKKQKVEEFIDLLLEIIEPTGYPQLIKKIYSADMYNILKNNSLENKFKNINKKVGHLNIVEILNKPSYKYRKEELIPNFINFVTNHCNIKEFIKKYNELSVNNLDIFNLSNKDDSFFKYFLEKQIQQDKDLTPNLKKIFKEGYTYIDIDIISKISHIIENHNINKIFLSEDKNIKCSDFLNINKILNEEKTEKEINEIIEKYIYLIIKKSKKSLEKIFRNNLNDIDIYNLDTIMFNNLMLYAKKHENIYFNKIYDTKKLDYFKNYKGSNYTENTKTIELIKCYEEKDKILEGINCNSIELEYLKNKKRI